MVRRARGKPPRPTAFFVQKLVHFDALPLEDLGTFSFFKNVCVRVVTQLHYVSDEIYGGASAWLTEPGAGSLAAASSAPVVAAERLGWEGLGDRLHVCYALSKDFGTDLLAVTNRDWIGKRRKSNRVDFIEYKG